jgi:hypothetical protein
MEFFDSITVAILATVFLIFAVGFYLYLFMD